MSNYLGDPSSESDERPLSTRDAAAYLGVSTKTIQRWKKEGRLVPHGSYNSGDRGSPVITYLKEDLKRAEAYKDIKKPDVFEFTVFGVPVESEASGIRYMEVLVHGFSERVLAALPRDLDPQYIPWFVAGMKFRGKGVWNKQFVIVGLTEISFVMYSAPAD